MWKSRDYGMLAAAAIATFGLTVGMFWPRLANAVEEKPAATTEVKVPTLTVGTVQVTAKMDDAHPHTVLLTAKNTSDQQASAKFKASASVTSPSSELSRVGPMSRQVWTGEYAFDLQAHESQTTSVQLADKAFVEVPDNTATNLSQIKGGPQQSQVVVRQIMRTVPGGSYLMLTDAEGKQGIRALSLPVTLVPAPEKTVEKTVKSVTQVRRLNP